MHYLVGKLFKLPTRDEVVCESKFGLDVSIGMLLIPGTGNGERGTGNGEPGTGVWERVYSGNLLRVQNGGQNKRKGSKRNNLG